MARKGGRGGNKAARSAAAKKGWETRRRGGAKAKPAATKRTAASKAKAKPASKPTARRGMPKTTSARGRALTNQRRAADLVRASRGGKGPSAKAVRSVLTAQRARAFYAATGGGKKRSAVKAKSAAKIGKSIRAQGRAKATAARAKVAGRARAKPVSGAKQALIAARARFKSDMASARGEADRARARAAFKSVVRRAKREEPSSVMAPRRGKKPQAIRQAQQRLPKSALRNPKGNAKGAIATRLASRERVARFAVQNFGGYGAVGRTTQRQYDRAQRSLRTAANARQYLSTGKLPGRDNSIRAQREMRQAQARLTATNAARQAGRLPTPGTGSAQQRAAGLRARADQLRQQGNALMGGGRRDGAIVNAPLSSRARSGSINAGFRGLEMTRRADQLESRARGVEVRAQQSAAKAAREAAKPKPQRKPAAQRASRARGIVQRRERKGSGTQRQWENAVRTERRALAFLGAKPKQLTSQQQFWRDMVR